MISYLNIPAGGGGAAIIFFKDYVSFYRLRGGGGGPIDPTGQWVAAGAKIWYDEG